MAIREFYIQALVVLCVDSLPQDVDYLFRWGVLKSGRTRKTEIASMRNLSGHYYIADMGGCKDG